MLRLRQLLALLKILFASRAEIMLENIALRHQIFVLSPQRLADASCFDLDARDACRFGSAYHRLFSFLSGKPASGRATVFYRIGRLKFNLHLTRSKLKFELQTAYAP